MNKDIVTSKGKIYIRELDVLKPSKPELQAAITALLSEKLQLSDVKISHTDHGKPFITTHPQLQFSISHTSNLIAVYLSGENPAGIDIELYNPKISTAKPHFINPDEHRSFERFSDDDLHLIWGAKEAIFKHFSGNFTDLQKQVTITCIEKDLISASTVYGQVQCFYIVVPDYYIVWTC